MNPKENRLAGIEPEKRAGLCPDGRGWLGLRIAGPVASPDAHERADQHQYNSSRSDYCRSNPGGGRQPSVMPPSPHNLDSPASTESVFVRLPPGVDSDPVILRSSVRFLPVPLLQSLPECSVMVLKLSANGPVPAAPWFRPGLRITRINLA
jgi:hypothetical protein